MHATSILAPMPRKASKTQRPRNKIENFVARYRAARGWSQEELAEAVGLSQSVLSRIERRMVTMTDDTRKRIADALGLSDPNMVYVDPDRPDLNAAAAGLDERDLEEIHEIIRMKLRMRTLEG